MSLRESLTAIRHLSTAIVALNLVAFIALLLGLANNWTKFFVPYFGYAGVTILVALVGCLYSFLSPGQWQIALMEMIFALLEAKHLYAVVSYYRELMGTSSAFSQNPEGIKGGGGACCLVVSGI